MSLSLLLLVFKYYIFANKLHYNSFHKVSAYISGHRFWNVPIYCIRVFTFDVRNVISSRNNKWCEWSKFVWQKIFFCSYCGFYHHLPDQMKWSVLPLLLSNVSDGITSVMFSSNLINFSFFKWANDTNISCQLGWHQENNGTEAVTLFLETSYNMQIIWHSRKSNFCGVINKSVYIFKDLPFLFQNIR